MKLKSLILTSGFLLALIGCEGPQGPMGNANVTIWKTSVSSSNWVEDGTAYRYSFNCPAINSEVVGGTYQVVSSLRIGDNTWVNSPFITAGTDYTETCQFYFQGGDANPNCGLFAYADDNVTTIHESIYEIKIAVIEGLSGKRELTVSEVEENPHLFNITYINN
jgi:hypothetical protein